VVLESEAVMSEWSESRLSSVTFTRDRVLTMLQDGRTVQSVADLSSWPRPQVMRVGFESGLRLVPSRDVMTSDPVSSDPVVVPVQREPIGQAAALQRLTEPEPTASPEPASVVEVAEPSASALDADDVTDDDDPWGRPPPSPEPEIAQPDVAPPTIETAKVRCESQVVDLAALCGHVDERVSRFAKTLRSRLVEFDAEQNAERDALRAKAQELRVELARIEAELAGDVTPAADPPAPKDSPAPKSKKKQPWKPASEPGVAPWSQIRAWCLEREVPCSTHGALRRSAVDAFLEAHPDLRAPS
jgi:hypothetical protein